jgi:hypothetical protein
MILSVKCKSAIVNTSAVYDHEKVILHVLMCYDVISHSALRQAQDFHFFIFGHVHILNPKLS